MPSSFLAFFLITFSKGCIAPFGGVLDDMLDLFVLFDVVAFLVLVHPVINNEQARKTKI
jgi:hypothetical protein